MGQGDGGKVDARRPRRRVAPGSERRGKAPTPEGPNPKIKAKELTDKGMPYQLAMSVARGRITLSEAIERMARDEQVEQLIAKHELSRALATQIALGHASLDRVLAKRRMAQHIAENAERSVLDESVGSGEPWMLGLFGARRAEATVSAAEAYDVTVLEAGGEPEVLHKLSVKYAYRPTAWKTVRKGMKTDKALAKAPQAPQKRPQDRYNCSDKRLFRYLDEGGEVQATLLEGEVIRGTVTWFSRFEIGLDIKGAELVVFRHALHDLRTA